MNVGLTSLPTASNVKVLENYILQHDIFYTRKQYNSIYPLWPQRPQVQIIDHVRIEKQYDF